MPFVFFEIKYLATRGESQQIVPLIESVIAVTQRRADSLLNLPHVAEEDTAAAETDTQSNAA